MGLESSLDSKTKEIGDLTSELDSANEVITNTSGALDKLKTEKSAVDAELEDWKLKYQELNINFKHLTDKIADIQPGEFTHIQKLDMIDDELKRLRDLVKNLSEQNAELTSNLAEAAAENEAKGDANAEADQKIGELNEENEDLKNQ